MIDAVFDLQGDALPLNYVFSLWDELSRRVPQLLEDDTVAVLPLRTSGDETGILLPKRAKLVLRLPRALQTSLHPLINAELNIDGHWLRLGKMKPREISPYPTLHAPIVASDEEEPLFIHKLQQTLAQREIVCHWICGQRRELKNAQRTVRGYSLVLHDLKPEDSLKLQFSGLHTGRQWGCGVFIPYKIISGLN